MTDKLASRTPTLDAVLHALIDPARTDFEIRHLDLGRDRLVWLAELRREIAGLSVRAACADQPWQPRVAELASELRQNCCVAPDGSTIYVNGPRILRVAKQLEALLSAPPSPEAPRP